MSHNDVRRLFFGFQLEAPWPEKCPDGRKLDEVHRHLTAAFLGNVSLSKVECLLPQLPRPTFQVGLAGHFSRCIFLPRHHPRVVAWELEWSDNPKPFLDYQTSLSHFLRQQGFDIDDRPFLPHVTLCRLPFSAREWSDAFTPLPCIITNLHLFESVGSLKYEPHWTYPIHSPFTEIEHTADIAFKIVGEDYDQLYTHAQTALAFRFPPLLTYFPMLQSVRSVEEIVEALNAGVTTADAEIGCPLKAVSYHGKAKQNDAGIYEWEMIVDV